MEIDLKSLVSQIHSIDGTLKNEASKAVNILLTIRNWMIGYYIVEYEQKGADKGKYGDKILEAVAEDINKDGLSLRNLRLFKQFFLAYPQISNNLADRINNLFSIRQTVSAEFMLENNGNRIVQSLPAQFALENNDNQIRQSLTAEFELKNNDMGIRQTVSAEFMLENNSNRIVQTPSAQFKELVLSEEIVNKLSFSHITLLLPIDNPAKRNFTLAKP